ncbi:MAG: hypothetical protein EZS28_041367 [Streblomastix strix]|uniref:Uncharacterized protein n=1 Tax=Streblomastix strix TaxID=222440 RepID=A0A5J4TY06_9EUKA|nr:MAG: hypothetical protein EZS28_041367 [Streblomastix strix]
MGDYPWNNYETVRVKRPRDDDGDNEFIQMKRPRLGESPHTSYGNKTNDIDMDLSHINSQSNIGQSSNLQQIDPIQNNFPSTSTPLTLTNQDPGIMRERLRAAQRFTCSFCSRDRYAPMKTKCCNLQLRQKEESLSKLWNIRKRLSLCSRLWFI